MKFVYFLGCSWQLRGWERLCEVLSMQISAKSAVLPFVLICIEWCGISGACSVGMWLGQRL